MRRRNFLPTPNLARKLELLEAPFRCGAAMKKIATDIYSINVCVKRTKAFVCREFVSHIISVA